MSACSFLLSAVPSREGRWYVFSRNTGLQNQDVLYWMASPEGEPVVRELPWQGSGDIVALAQANCFIVLAENRLEMDAGEWADVLPRRGFF